MQRKILVTGGTGYIGSHTAVELLSEGFEVLIADNLSNSNEEVLNGIEQITGKRPEFEQLDLSDERNVKALFHRHSSIDAVIHFAARKAVGESVNNPLLYYKNNLFSLVLILDQIRANNIAGIIFSSSCTVYGQPDQLPVTESTLFKKAESPYGKTKQMGEEILLDACKADGNLNAIALRYFNPVGAHHTGLIGELPIGVPSNLVPFITQTAAGLRDQLKVFGNDYNTPDGSALRDYIHVVDLAKAHVTSLRRILQGKQKSNYEYFNIGTGKSISVLELIHKFERVNQVKLNYAFAERRSGDIEKIWADTSLAKEELAWQATHDVDDMMRSAWRWQKRLLTTQQTTNKH
jgi:UDP-glucose 4-epimerase